MFSDGKVWTRQNRKADKMMCNLALIGRGLMAMEQLYQL